MAKQGDPSDLPDLEEFRQRIEAAAAATEDFAEAVGAAAPQQGTPAQPQQQAQDTQGMRDLLNALHLIHDEAVQIRESLQRILQ